MELVMDQLEIIDSLSKDSLSNCNSPARVLGTPDALPQSQDLPTVLHGAAAGIGVCHETQEQNHNLHLCFAAVEI